MIEIELKIRLTNGPAMRQRLAAAGAVNTHDELETNTLFDTAARGLLTADVGLRIRECAPKSELPSHAATMTYKGAARATTTKTREEIEFEISDGSAAAALLGKLGYHPVVIYEKRRESWRLGDCTVTLDELPALGTWLEIEGPGEAAVHSVRELLGLTGAELTRESYVAMAAREGRARADGAVELRF